MEHQKSQALWENAIVRAIEVGPEASRKMLAEVEAADQSYELAFWASPALLHALNLEAARLTRDEKLLRRAAVYVKEPNAKTVAAEAAAFLAAADEATVHLERTPKHTAYHINSTGAKAGEGRVISDNGQWGEGCVHASGQAAAETKEAIGLGALGRAV